VVLSLIRFENRGKCGINAKHELGLEIDTNTLKPGD
jgi:hypothetical protein